MIITRGFTGRNRETQAARGRVPPGQAVTPDFPVLTAGPTQHVALEDWSLEIELNEESIASWSWADFLALPQSEIKTDIHCVTKWTKLDTRWGGVMLDDILAAAGVADPPAAYALVHCDGGYSTNLPIADLLGGRAMVATRYEDEPIAAAHGGPARLLVPHLYFWKSAKWIRRIALRADNAPGFWESLGYHLYGDPWREQRYTGDQ